MTKEARAKGLTTGIENPKPDVSEAILEAEAAGKGRYSRFLHFLNNYQNFTLHPSLTTYIMSSTPHMCFQMPTRNQLIT